MSEQGSWEVFIAPIMWAELSRHAGVEQTETGPVCRKYVTETRSGDCKLRSDAS